MSTPTQTYISTIIMRALSNAKPRRGEANPPTIGFAPNVLPEANGSHTGVSVRSGHPPTTPTSQHATKWFVLRITYNRAMQANAFLNNHGIETFMPLRYTTRTVNGKQRRVTTPLLPNLLFAHTNTTTLNNLLRSLKLTPPDSFSETSKTKDKLLPSKLITFYYNHFHTGNNGRNPPLTVPDDAMNNFIRLTSINNEHIRIVRPEQCHYKSGDLVRIIDGEFKGICGRVARVAGQQRVVVELHGVCLVTTAYVPSGFIENVLRKDKQT